MNNYVGSTILSYSENSEKQANSETMRSITINKAVKLSYLKEHKSIVHKRDMMLKE